jgi:hypothetical protein
MSREPIEIKALVPHAKKWLRGRNVASLDRRKPQSYNDIGGKDINQPGVDWQEPAQLAGNSPGMF